MKNRGGADASQAGTSGGRGKWLPRDHHYPLAPAARPIRAGGCSGCVTSGDPFPLPEGPEIADGRNAAGRLRGVNHHRVNLATNSTPARSARLRRARSGNFRPPPRRSVAVLALGIGRNHHHAPAAPRWGIRQGRFRVARGSAGAGGSANSVNMPPRGAGGLGDWQQRRCAARGAAGRATRGALLAASRCRVKIDPHTPASRQRAARGVAGRVTRKRLLARPGNTGGKDRLQADGRRAADQEQVPTCGRSRGAVAPARAQPR